jgi:hypothetical protein
MASAPSRRAFNRSPACWNCLWQPWATLAASGLKGFETRHWATKYRGPLLIHAAQRWTAEERWCCQQKQFRIALGELGYADGSQLPRGCCLGVVELTAIYPAEQVRGYLGGRERAFGDYSDGRFAWELKRPRPLTTPLPMRGGRQLWNVDVQLILPHLSPLETRS